MRLASAKSLTKPLLSVNSDLVWMKKLCGHIMYFSLILSIHHRDSDRHNDHSLEHDIVEGKEMSSILN